MLLTGLLKIHFNKNKFDLLKFKLLAKFKNNFKFYIKRYLNLALFTNSFL